MTDIKNFMKQNKIHQVVGIKFPNYGFTSFQEDTCEKFRETTYYYKNIGYDFKENDVALVQVNDELKICKVVELVDDNMTNLEKVNKATKSIIGKVDISCKIKEIKDMQRQIYLKNKIEELKAEFEETKMLEMLAGSDPEAAKIINEFKTLRKRLGK